MNETMQKVINELKQRPKLAVKKVKRREVMKDTELRIISDGTVAGTKVVDSKGNRIKLIQKIKWELSLSSGISKVTLKIKKMPINAVAKKTRAS